jgi:hypothetical protein
MRIDTILVVQVPTSYIGLPAEKLATIIQDAFTQIGSNYTAVHVHTSDGPLIFRKEEATHVDRELVSRKANDANFYRMQDRARMLARSVRLAW